MKKELVKIKGRVKEEDFDWRNVYYNNIKIGEINCKGGFKGFDRNSFVFKEDDEIKPKTNIGLIIEQDILKSNSFQEVAEKMCEEHISNIEWQFNYIKQKLKELRK